MRAQPKVEEGLVGVLEPLVMDSRAAEMVKPGQHPLDHPTVATEPRLVLSTLARDAAGDAAPCQEAVTAAHVVPFVGVQACAGACAAARSAA